MSNSLKHNRQLNAAQLTGFIIVVFCIVTGYFFVNWGNNNTPFTYDANQYYSYIIALFKKHDLFFEDGTYGFWLSKSELGKYVPKVTYGMSVFYLPFYLVADLFYGKTSTGYETLYGWFIHVGCIFYVLLGLFLTLKSLRHFFSDIINSVSLFVIFFGSNLLCYTLVNSELTHSVLFFLLSFFVNSVIMWHKQKQAKYFLLASFLLGFIVLIRPTEIICFVVLLLFGVNSLALFKDKLKSLLTLKWYLLLALILFMIPLFPQFLYWKIQTGFWLYFSYGESERFFWSDPEILNVLVSYRKGWLLYSPLMIISLLGFIPMYKQKSKMFWPSLCYFLINLYVISCWWDWSYGGSFGMRALTHAGAILIFPLAFSVKWFIENIKGYFLKLVVSFVVLFFCLLNVFQTNLYKHGIISYDGMTKEAYWFTFLKKNYTKDELEKLEMMTYHPDYNAMKQGKRD